MYLTGKIIIYFIVLLTGSSSHERQPFVYVCDFCRSRRQAPGDWPTSRVKTEQNQNKTNRFL